jgi:thioredoxin-related protein
MRWIQQGSWIVNSLGAAAMVCLSASAVISFAAAADNDPVHWYNDVQQASSAARESNRPMVLDFWADWCAACRVMESDVYTSNEFIEATKHLTPVRIDFDKQQELARKYNITGLPTILFTDSYGTELLRLTGYISAKAFNDVIHALPADVSEFNRLTRVLATDKNNFEALQGMGKNLRAAGLYLSSNEYYSKAVGRPEAKTNADSREEMLTAIGLNFLELKQSKQAADAFDKCLKEFPASSRRPEWTLNLGKAYALGEKKDKAKAKTILESLIRENAGGAQSEEAKKLIATL